MKPRCRPDQHDPALAPSRHASRQRSRDRGSGDEVHQSQSYDLRGILDQVARRPDVAHSGNEQRKVYRACVMRFRPILMTTMAAMLGGVPMMLGTGAGSEIRQPLGYAIVGGLAVSQLLTLYTTPVVYIYLDRLQSRLFGKKDADHRSSDDSSLGSLSP